MEKKLRKPGNAAASATPNTPTTPALPVKESQAQLRKPSLPQVHQDVNSIANTPAAQVSEDAVAGADLQSTVEVDGQGTQQLTPEVRFILVHRDSRNDLIILQIPEGSQNDPSFARAATMSREPSAHSHQSHRSQHSHHSHHSQNMAHNNSSIHQGGNPNGSFAQPAHNGQMGYPNEAWNMGGFAGQNHMGQMPQPSQPYGSAFGFNGPQSGQMNPMMGRGQWGPVGMCKSFFRIRVRI